MQSNLPEQTAPKPHTSLLIDLTPLRTSPAFARLWAGTAISGIGQQMTIVTIGLHVYFLTESSFAVGMVAAFALLPVVLSGLYAGSIADAFDRRIVALASASVSWLTIILIALVAWLQLDNIWLLYILTAINSVAFTVNATVRKAIVPRLVPRELLPAAGALGGFSIGAMMTVGPALGALVVAGAGFEWAYTIDALLYVGAFIGIVTLPSIPPQGKVERAGFGSIVNGLRFLGTARNIQGGFVLDIFAMGLGQPRVLFPAIGALSFGGGAATVGILAAALAVGMIVSGLFSGPLGRVRWQGRAIAWSVAAYGLCVVGFGLAVLWATLTPVPLPTDASGTGAVGELIGQAAAGGDAIPTQVGVHWAALITGTAFLVLSGVADNISAVFRNTMLQTAAPDAMRGRLQGVFTVVVTGGPRLGDILYGALALVFALWVPAVLGGILVVVCTVLFLRRNRQLLDYDGLNPVP